MTAGVAEPTYRPVLPIFVGDRKLPEGCDTWGIRSVRADFTSSRGFRWPYPGGWAEAAGPFDDTNTDGCPSAEGDGICLADTYRGMASAIIPARTILLCAYASADVLGTTVADGKHRVRRALVVDVIDGERVAGANLRGAYLAGANLAGANLRGANLAGANLAGAYLAGAYLAGAYLAGANLRGANLAGANLAGAYLAGANLAGAYLAGANLRGAYLAGAYLTGANLAGAYLAGAYLAEAYLTGANLAGANLARANLTRANLRGANADRYTAWPAGFDAAAAGVVTA